MDVNRIHLTSGVVYIAGVECPVESITVSGGDGIIPTMVVSLPASVDLVRFGEEDRVPIVAFYLDQWYSPTGNPQDIVPTMRLLFDGEISDWSYQKTTGGDYINFDCTANINMLSSMAANFLIGQNTADQATELSNYSTTQGIVTGDFAAFPLILLNQGLFSGKQKPLDRPFDFISNLLLATKIGGYPGPNAIGDNGKYTSAFAAKMIALDGAPRISAGAYQDFVIGLVPSVMGFFSVYSQRTKFDRRFIATPLEAFSQADTPSDIPDKTAYIHSADPQFAAIRSDIFRRATEHSLESLFGQGDSFLKILNTYYSINSYQLMMLPTAPYVLVGRDPIENTGASISSAGIPLSNPGSGGDSQARLGNNISKPVAYFALPPECNIAFPGLIDTISFAEDYTAQTTRTVAGNPFLAIAQVQGTTPEQDKATTAATVNGWPFDLGKLVREGPGKGFASLLLYPEEYFKGPVVNSITIPSWYTALREASGLQDAASAGNKNAQNSQTADGEAPVDIKAVADAITKSGAEGVDPDQAQAYGESRNRTKALSQDTKLLLFSNYVRMSHYESRFSYRKGQASGPFNPYILPCHSFVFLDVAAAGMHIMGYIASFQHRMSAVTGSSTSFSYTFGRTLKENCEIAIGTHYNLALTNKIAATPFHLAAPLEPTKTIADTLQNEANAAAYYKQTYYQNADQTTAANQVKKEYVFKFGTYFDTSNDPLGIAGSLPTSTTPVVNPNPSTGEPGVYEVVLHLKQENIDNLTDYNKAMQKVARPICTLDQYISFINGGSANTQTQNAASGRTGVIPADVYGVPVPVTIRTYLASSLPAGQSRLEHYIVPTSKVPTGNSAPQDLRRDWPARIQRYRVKMYGRVVQ